MEKALKTVIIGIALLTLVGTVFAFSDGVTGHTTGCNPCHGSSADPDTSVTIAGLPAQYDMGTTYLLTITVTSTTIVGSNGGFDLNVTAGTLNSTDPNVKIVSNEATHKNNNARSWQVNWTTPAGPSPVTFRVAAVASNNTGTSNSRWNTEVRVLNVIPEFQGMTILIAFAAVSMITLILARKRVLRLFNKTI